MAKRLQEYVKYTIKELDQYVQTEGSCVRKVNTKMHLSMGPFCLADFKHVLNAHIVRSKVGFYDIHLDGIVLDVKRVKVLGTTGAMRADDPRIHVNINADVYLFKPTEGAVLSGVVKHIGAHHVGVVLYRVFNANLRVDHKVDKEEVQMDKEVKFRIRTYNLQNVFPYIDGELLSAAGETTKPKAKKITFKDADSVDSGIEEKEHVQELDELVAQIKSETPEECEEKPSKKKSKSSKKLTDSQETESSEKPAKKSRKRKSLNAANDSTQSELILSPKKIKTEPLESAATTAMPKKKHKNNDLSLSPAKKVKKEKSASKDKTKVDIKQADSSDD